MQFSPIEDWRNWHTASRMARTAAGGEVTVAQSSTQAAVFLSQRLPVLQSLRTHAELLLTPQEAFTLGAELMCAGMQSATGVELKVPAAPQAPGRAS